MGGDASATRARSGGLVLLHADDLAECWLGLVLALGRKWTVRARLALGQSHGDGDGSPSSLCQQTVCQAHLSRPDSCLHVQSPQHVAAAQLRPPTAAPAQAAQSFNSSNTAAAAAAPSLRPAAMSTPAARPFAPLSVRPAQQQQQQQQQHQQPSWTRVAVQQQDEAADDAAFFDSPPPAAAAAAVAVPSAAFVANSTGQAAPSAKLSVAHAKPAAAAAAVPQQDAQGDGSDFFDSAPAGRHVLGCTAMVAQVRDVVFTCHGRAGPNHTAMSACKSLPGSWRQ